MRARLLTRGQSSGRSDDNAGTILKRFATFKSQSLPVIEHYAALGKAARISAVNSPDEVFDAVRVAIEPVMECAAAAMHVEPMLHSNSKEKPLTEQDQAAAVPALSFA
jgi:hypothetical protein